MKLSAAITVALIHSCAALSESENLHEYPDSQGFMLRAATATCSIGIARLSGSISWDLTVYNVPQPMRQDENIIVKMVNAQMDKGQSITVQTPSQAITITNVDNAPVFDYDIPSLQAPISDPDTGKTKVQLKFDIPSAGLTWTTDDCYAGNVVFSAGRESWSCDFPCTV